MKYLYKYPHAAYPYADLVQTNRRRSRSEMEYELLDTGIFEDDRYFDVFVEYAKDRAGGHPGAITATNRGPDACELHLCPPAWFRTTGHHGWHAIATELTGNQSSGRSSAGARHQRDPSLVRCLVPYVL